MEYIDDRNPFKKKMYDNLQHCGDYVKQAIRLQQSEYSRRIVICVEKRTTLIANIIYNMNCSYNLNYVACALMRDAKRR